MDPYKQHRDNMYTFIIDCINEYVFDRDSDNGGGLAEDFDTYEAFKRHQRSVVDGLDLNSLTFIQQIQNLCLVGKLSTYDVERGAKSGNGGFHFSRDGEIVIVVPR